MRKFKDVLPRLFPKHFQIKPANIYVKLDEALTDSVEIADARLTGRIKPTDTTIPYDTLTGTFKSSGVVKIDDEYIKYTSNSGNILSGLTRGYLSSEVADHYNKEIFTAELANDIDASIETISIKNLIGDPPEYGGFKIDNEYITYRHYNKYEDTFTFYQCHRGGNLSLPTSHKVDSSIVEYEETIIKQIDTIKYDKNIWSANLTSSIGSDDLLISFDSVSGDGITELSGEFRIDNEIIRYEDIEYVLDGNGKITSGTFKGIYETVYNNSISNPTSTNTVKGLLRGIKGTNASDHTSGSIITELRDYTLNQNGGYILIDDEYISYWYIDDEYIYVTERGVSKFKGTLPTFHDIGTTIIEYPGINHNRNSSDFVDVIAQHLDQSVEKSLVRSESLKDVSKVDSEYLPYLVKDIGEDLNDYKWLNIDNRAFAQELTNIYKEKGLEAALRLWSKLGNFTDSGNRLVDLWTFNYNDFFSILILAALIYIPTYERDLTVVNFYYPQISDTLYAELIEILNSVRFYGESIENWKIDIKNWTYLNKFDDGKKGDDGFRFDDRIAPEIYTNNKVDWEKSVWQSDSGFTSDMGPSNWAANQQWLPYIPDGETGYLPTDAIFLHSDELPEESEIVLVHRTTGEEKKFDDEFCLDYKNDVWKHKDDIDDNGNSGYLYSSITEDDTTIQVYNIDKEFYNPSDYMWTFTNPVLKPYGYIKIDDEIMRYSSLTTNSSGITTLYNVERAKNQTIATSHSLEPFTLYNELFNRPVIEVEYDEDGNAQTGVYRILVENDPENYDVEVGDTLILDTNDSGDDFAGTFTVSNIYREYYPTEQAWIYGIDYIDDTNPVVGLSVDFTSFSSIKNTLYDWETGWQKWTEGDDKTDDNNYPNIVVTVNDTKITKKVKVINHQYSQYQWFLWRLLNEINGDYLKDSFYNNTGVTCAKSDIGFKSDSVLPDFTNWDFYKPPDYLHSSNGFETDALYFYNNNVIGLNTPFVDMADDILYEDISNGIIWATPHFKWFLKVAPSGNSKRTINERLDIIKTKIQEYKPKHTVMESVLSYNLGLADIDLTSALSIDENLWSSLDLNTTAISLYDGNIWVKNTTYLSGDIVTATTPDGVTQYKCTVAGTSGAGEPVWDTVVGHTTVDNTVTWIAESVDFSYSNLILDNTIWSSVDFSGNTGGFSKESYVMSDMGLRNDGNYEAWFDYGAEEKLPVATTGRCYDFNGTDQYVDVGTLSTNIVADGKFSVSFMMEVGTLPYTSNDIIASYTIDSNNWFYITTDLGTSNLKIVAEANSVSGNKSFSISGKTGIINITITFDTTTWHAYVDNVNTILSGALDMSTTVGTPNWKIGNHLSYYFTGKMFDVKLFNKALSSDEVSEIYNREYASYENLVTNGTFDSSSNWTLSPPWTIGSGVAHFDATSNNNLYETNANIISGKQYKLSFDIISSGTSQLKIWGGYVLADFVIVNQTGFSNGKHSITFTASSSTTGLIFRAYSSGGAIFDIDNIILSEFPEDGSIIFNTSDLYRYVTAWYKMNENSLPTMIDSTANSNNGTIMNGVDDFFKPQPIIEDYEYKGNYLSDGGMENWLTATNLNSWIESLSGTSTVNRESTDYFSGDNSCRIDVDALNSDVSIYNTATLDIDIECRLTITYKNSAALKTLKYYILDTTTSKYLQSDGTWLNSITYLTVNNSTSWNIYTNNFIPESSGNFRILIINDSAASSSIYIDNVKIEEKIPDYFQTDYMFIYNDDLTPNLNADTALIENMAQPICDIGYTTETEMSDIPGYYLYEDTNDFYKNSIINVTTDDNYPI